MLSGCFGLVFFRPFACLGKQCVWPFSFLGLLQSIHVTRDHGILKFEARVQIYVAGLNIGCKIQNSGGNVISFSKINSREISF